MMRLGALLPRIKFSALIIIWAKKPCRNLMALRFANALFEPLWNSAHIDHVQITVAETLGVEARAAYYDHVGALRDMVQNHIVQLMCLVAMETPRSDASNDVRDEKLKILRALKPIHAGTVEQVTVRGQYRGGVASEDSKSNGKVKSYVEELGTSIRYGKLCRHQGRD